MKIITKFSVPKGSLLLVHLIIRLKLEIINLLILMMISLV